MRALIVVLSILALAAAGGGWYWQHNSKPNITFKTAEVKRGELLATISATGTIEPMDVIDVGAQVAGRILTFGKDADGKTVDYGSRVSEGMLLANIDDMIPRSDLENAKAQKAQAEATLQHSMADLDRLKALSAQADAEWERVQKFPHSEALAQNDYETFKANAATAKANLAVGEAAILQAKAGVQQAEAVLPRAEANVKYTKIMSPVNGVIIDRRVNIGQTVVAGLSAPSLFLIAEDLGKMQLWVAVNEADVGNIHPGQNVSFTVDAYPGEVFKGEVNKVRLNATMTQNVVTYTVEVNTDNSNHRLLPYLTANVQFEVKKDENVLLVPNAALRWYPQPQSVAPDVRAAAEARDAAGPAGGADKPAAAPAASPSGTDSTPPTTRPRRRRNGGDAEKSGTIWIQEGQYVRPVTVTVGPTDTINTEVASADLKEGAPVIVGEIHEDDTSNQTTNPFAPQMFRRGGRGGGGGGGGRGR
jgi:HlyD family secretion protein